MKMKSPMRFVIVLVVAVMAAIFCVSCSDTPAYAASTPKLSYTAYDLSKGTAIEKGEIPCSLNNKIINLIPEIDGYEAWAYVSSYDYIRIRNSSAVIFYAPVDTPASSYPFYITDISDASSGVGVRDLDEFRCSPAPFDLEFQFDRYAEQGNYTDLPSVDAVSEAWMMQEYGTASFVDVIDKFGESFSGCLWINDELNCESVIYSLRPMMIDKDSTPKYISVTDFSAYWGGYGFNYSIHGNIGDFPEEAILFIDSLDEFAKANNFEITTTGNKTPLNGSYGSHIVFESTETSYSVPCLDWCGEPTILELSNVYEKPVGRELLTAFHFDGTTMALYYNGAIPPEPVPVPVPDRLPTADEIDELGRNNELTIDILDQMEEAGIIDGLTAQKYKHKLEPWNAVEIGLPDDLKTDYDEFYIAWDYDAPVEGTHYKFAENVGTDEIYKLTSTTTDEDTHTLLACYEPVPADDPNDDDNGDETDPTPSDKPTADPAPVDSNTPGAPDTPAPTKPEETITPTVTPSSALSDTNGEENAATTPEPPEEEVISDNPTPEASLPQTSDRGASVWLTGALVSLVFLYLIRRRIYRA